jgi:biotin synthase-related radical SAM superfamily protein
MAVKAYQVSLQTQIQLPHQIHDQVTLGIEVYFQLKAASCISKCDYCTHNISVASAESQELLARVQTFAPTAYWKGKEKSIIKLRTSHMNIRGCIQNFPD